MIFKGTGNSIIREIQSELISDKVSVSNILRKARLTARKLDLNEFEKWIINESDGYKDTTANNLPDYRKIGCVPRFFNPYRGWCPIIIEDKRLYELCHTSYLFQSIAELESLLVSEGSLTYAYPPDLAKVLRDGMDMQFDIRAFVSQSSLAQPINAVKNVILDWAVDLEKAGISGNGLGFTNEDKKEAQNVTQNIYAQNIGNLGNVSDKSSVTNTLSHSTFSLEQTDTYVKQISDCIPALPENLRPLIQAEIERIIANKNTGDVSAVKTALRSIKTICESAAGNIAAAGIVALIANSL